MKNTCSVGFTSGLWSLISDIMKNIFFLNVESEWRRTNVRDGKASFIRAVTRLSLTAQYHADVELKFSSFRAIPLKKKKNPNRWINPLLFCNLRWHLRRLPNGSREAKVSRWPRESWLILFQNNVCRTKTFWQDRRGRLSCARPRRTAPNVANYQSLSYVTISCTQRSQQPHSSPRCALPPLKRRVFSKLPLRLWRKEEPRWKQAGIELAVSD